MPDRQQPQPEAGTGADKDGALVAYRLAWGLDHPEWQVTTDLEPIPEADMF